MSAAFRPALPVIAFQLAAAVEHYQMALEELVDGALMARGLAHAGALLDEVMLLAAAFPPMAGDVVELVLGHAGWTRSLVGRTEDAGAGSPDDLAGRQSAAAARIHQKCLALFCREGA